jgi:hypothetical protein
MAKRNNNNIILLLLFLVLIILSYIFLKKTKENFQAYDPNKNAKLIFNDFQCGLFCMFNKLLHYLVIYPNTKEIQYNVISNLNNHKPFIGNGIEIFSQLFEVYKEPNTIIEEIYDIPGGDFKKPMPTHQYAYNYYNENRSRLEPYYYAFKKYIILKPHLQSKLYFMTKELHEDCDQVIGIFVRSNALASEQPSGKMPTRDDYLNAIKNIDTISKKTKYFLRIDNEEDLDFYKSKLTPNYFTQMKRSAHNKGDAPHTESEEFLPREELENTYLEIALLSTCEILVHCTSNMATASLMMNKEQISICVSPPI